MEVEVVVFVFGKVRVVFILGNGVGSFIKRIYFVGCLCLGWGGEGFFEWFSEMFYWFNKFFF